MTVSGHDFEKQNPTTSVLSLELGAPLTLAPTIAPRMSIHAYLWEELFPSHGKARSGQVISILVAIWIAIGAALGCFFEGWAPDTGIYVVAQIVTTVGYGDVTFTSQEGKLCMAAYAFLTILLVAWVLGDASSALLDIYKERLRLTLRVIESKLDRGVRSDEETRQKYSRLNDVVSAVMLAVAFVGLGTLYYALSDFCDEQTKGIDGQCGMPGVGKTWADAVYMSVITLTTIGFGDVVPATRAGRLFGTAWMFFGVCALGNLVATIQHYLQAEKQLLQMKKMSHHLFAHIDTNQDGVLSREEFLRYALMKFEFVDPDDLILIDIIFDSLDANHSGTLTKSEVVEGCAR
eukprot:TRINITY_DN30891_c0_g1_i1.p1 TRINITY_DN30891_c0_g1~~TRINITY_DN30891_c0_g1_i1.p1  ORF type:complete len:348 (-),score=55.84 TRINITY_DN30891_c0_g1_i1:237-1280(-)